MFQQIRSDLKKAMSFIDRTLVKGGWDENERAFIKHNREVWKDLQPQGQGGEILLESSSMASSVIAFSYLANLLARLHNARIMAYLPGSKSIKMRLENRKANGIYRSFNVSGFIYYDLAMSQRQEVENLFDIAVARLQSKRDVEELRLEDVWIGDLLYDSHCMNHKVPTIVIDDPRFQNSLREAVCTYVFWRDYLNTHDVHAVIVSHTVYIQSGVVTRLAISRGIPVYQINATHLHYMTEKNLRAYNEFFYYPEQFLELPEEERLKGLAVARERLEQRFSGQVGVDMRYSRKSAYGRIGEKPVLKQSRRIKILVATHCFFDNPHPYGINLFPDFYEWLDFLGKISEQTDYDWYIKTHPDFLPGNIPIIEKFISKYPRFTMISPETSHLQLKEEGIDFGLSVYGTIGLEYAALGIPVINASLCNPRIRYRFNFHPRTVEEYRQMLLNLPGQKLDIDIKEVYEYYFMAFIHNVNDWLFGNYDDFIRDIGGYYQQFGTQSYTQFRNRFSQARHQQILSVLRQFVESGEYNLRRKFLEKGVA